MSSTEKKVEFSTDVSVQNRNYQDRTVGTKISAPAHINKTMSSSTADNSTKSHAVNRGPSGNLNKLFENLQAKKKRESLTIGSDEFDSANWRSGGIKTDQVGKYQNFQKSPKELMTADNAGATKPKSWDDLDTSSDSEVEDGTNMTKENNVFLKNTQTKDSTFSSKDTANSKESEECLVLHSPADEDEDEKIEDNAQIKNQILIDENPTKNNLPSQTELLKLLQTVHKNMGGLESRMTAVENENRELRKENKQLRGNILEMNAKFTERMKELEVQTTNCSKFENAIIKQKAKSREIWTRVLENEERETGAIKQVKADLREVDKTNYQMDKQVWRLESKMDAHFGVSSDSSQESSSDYRSDWELRCHRSKYYLHYKPNLANYH